MIRLVCSGQCTASTRTGRVHSLPSGVATRLFPNYFVDDLLLLYYFVQLWSTFVSRVSVVRYVHVVSS